ncbi:hypothetical protein E4631_08545 [Hymenobacter sp. UV11]|uniref:hypothetical protein n=1 Tax=Hymenobacter sp. UV11 TaxID=1849735 RepID=UPI00105B968F|nr:hypothetical protein [Hymenobacter sp. UV11]TDN36286.1 hypothetical protein A8B98_10250 [Hymenobacter sp. UV11]TFZ66994.1 hypothetical protein E4631_08545 [Hymenobacter sp. UV11]
MLDTIVFIAYIILALSVLVGSWRFRQLPTNLRYLVGLVGLEVITEVITYTLHTYHKPNLFINPLFIAGELWLLALVYDKTLHYPEFSRVRPWLAGAFVAYCALDFLLAPEVARFKPALQLIESLLILGLVALYFRKLLHELRVTQLEREPMFWVSVGLVINHLGKSQIYLFSNFLLTHYSHQLNLHIWDFHALLLAVLYSCYLVALWIRPLN